MTKNEKRVLDFLREYVEKHGYSPSYREITEACDLASQSWVGRILSALHDGSYITWTPNKGRSAVPVTPSRQTLHDVRDALDSYHAKQIDAATFIARVDKAMEHASA